MAQPIDAVRVFRNADYRRCPTMLDNVPVRRMRSVLTFIVCFFVVMGLLAATLPSIRTGVVIAVAVVVIIVIGYRVWNGRIGLRLRGLPPGRQSILFSSLLDANHFRLGWQRFGRVFTSNQIYKPTVAIGGLDFGAGVLRDHAAELRAAEFTHSEGVVGGAVRNQCGERHRVSRMVFAKAFAPAVVSAARPDLERIISRHLAVWSAESAGSADDRTLRSRMDSLSLEAWLALFFGITRESHLQLHDDLEAIFERSRFVTNPVPSPDDLATLMSTIDELARRPETLSASALRTLAERSPEALLDPVVPSNLVHILRTTRHDVAGLLSWCVYLLAHDPQWIHTVREAGADEAAASWVVSETLRLGQSEYLVREVVNPIRIDRFTIPRGWWLRILIRESHRDPEVFDRPDEFEPKRFADGPLSRSVYAPFGLDDHSCIGEAVARTAAKVFVSELAARYDVEVYADGPPVFEQHHHWAPPPEFRVRIVEQAAAEAAGDQASTL
jgi:cytochrome P450